MIITRQRKKPFPWKRALPPVIALALLATALSWAPSRTWIASGPLTPVWNATAPVWKPLAAPFVEMGEERTIAAQSTQIASLQKQLADARVQINDDDKQISKLQSALNDSQQQAALTQASKAAVVAGPAAQPTTAPADLGAQGTPDMRRTAAVWSAMDSEAAAKIVQKLPQEYVARVFALMSPDSVGAILENLPATYAAQLTQEHPELHR